MHWTFNYPPVKWRTPVKQEEQRSRGRKMYVWCLCNSCVLFGLRVPKKKLLTLFFPSSTWPFPTLDLPACRVSVLTGSGNFHDHTKKVCTAERLFVWRPFVHSGMTMPSTVIRCWPQDCLLFFSYFKLHWESRMTDGSDTGRCTTFSNVELIL